MAKKEVKMIDIYVKEDTTLMINGKQEKVKKGVQKMEAGKAQILLDAKVAEKVEGKKEDKEQ